MNHGKLFVLLAYVPIFMFFSGCRETAVMIDCNKPPEVKLLVSDTVIFLNQKVTLHAEVKDDGKIVKYEWRFGAFSWTICSRCDTTAVTPMQPDLYQCSVRVYDDGGFLSVAGIPIKVENMTPKTYIDAPIRAALNRHIPVHAEVRDDGAITQYQWKFGTTAWIMTSGSDTSIVTPGNNQTYPCSLQVTDNCGATATAYANILVQGYPPTAVITNNFVGGIYDTLHIHAVGADDMDQGLVVDYLWKFGSSASTWVSVKKLDSTSTKWISDTIITLPGTTGPYVCSLRVYDNDALYSTYTTFINVVKRPLMPFIQPRLTQTYINCPDTLNGSVNLSSPLDSIIQWEWKLGVAQPWRIGSKDTVLLATQPGVYLCSLKVTNRNALQAVAGTMINVLDNKLFVTVDAKDRYPYVNTKDSLFGNAYSINGDSIVRWDWKIGNKQWITSRKDTVIQPENAGTLACSLRVSTKSGVEGKNGITLFVKEPSITPSTMANPVASYANDSSRLAGSASALPRDSIIQ